LHIVWHLVAMIITSSMLFNQSFSSIVLDGCRLNHIRVATKYLDPLQFWERMAHIWCGKESFERDKFDYEQILNALNMHKDFWNIMNFDQNFIIETFQLMQPPFKVDNPHYCVSLVIFQKLNTTLLNIVSPHCGSFYFVCTYVA
jgi:hypothetical protein